jgi:hypothetical protein
MAIEYSIDTMRGLRIHTCTGAISADDILLALKALYSSPDYDHSRNSLWDFRNCTINLSGDEMRKIINFEQKNRLEPGGGKAALLVSSSVNFGLARMYNLLSEHKVEQTLMVFSDYDEAIRWLEEPKSE